MYTIKRFIMMGVTCAMLSGAILSPTVYAGSFKMGNYDLFGSRAIPSNEEPVLSRKNVLDNKFEVKWFSQLDGWVSAPPIVSDGLVFAGTISSFTPVYIPGNLISSGSIYGLNSKNGSIVWQTTIAGGLIASPMLNGNDLYVASYGGTLYKMDAKTGAIKWSTRLNLSGDGLDSIWSGPIKAGNKIIVTINPNDEFVGFPAGKSGIFAVDPASGNILWTTLNGQPDEGGRASWAISPSYSEKLGLVYFSTSNSTFAPSSPLPPYNFGDLGSDAVLAIRTSDGSIAWEQQVRKGDVWNFSDPFDPKHPLDTDIGDGPALFSIGKKEYVAFGSKRGYFYILDAATGTIKNDFGCSGDYKCGLDAYNGGGPDGQIGNGADGGYTLDSGYYTDKKMGTVHFSVLNDYTNALGPVARQEFPFDGSVGSAPAGTCGFGNFGFDGPECPSIDSGVVILNNEDGTQELGRFEKPNVHLASPTYLDGLIYVRATTNEASAPAQQSDTVIVLDVSNPKAIVQVDEIPLAFGAIRASSGGSTLTIGQETIFTGNGFFDFSSPGGVYAIGLKLK